MSDWPYLGSGYMVKTPEDLRDVKGDAEYLTRALYAVRYLEGNAMDDPLGQGWGIAWRLTRELIEAALKEPT